MLIDAQTQFNFIIGHPLTHSLSPSFHQALYQARKINAVMLAVEQPNLSDVVESIKTLGVRLTAVTMPYKTEILSFTDAQTPAVEIIGAANTLILQGDKLVAHNTDIDGIAYALAQIDLIHKKCLILGAGGAARAVAYVLNQNNAQIYYSNRTLEKASGLIEVFGGKVVGLESFDHHEMDVIINTTPVDRVYRFAPHQTVFDLRYYPKETDFLKSAKQAGCNIISGLRMFQAQANKQCDLAYGEDEWVTQ